MILYRTDTPDLYPYVYGIIVFDPNDDVFTNPLTWRKSIIFWNAANFSWEASFDIF